MGKRDSPSTELDPTVGAGPGGEPDAAPSTPADSASSKTTLERGQQLGRFIVLETLGVGGMGIVVGAYDTVLDRKVALKLLRPDVAPTQTGATAARASLLHEAQAMARLRHPNVVTVFEVGEYENQVFLAMEFVAGGTLSAWAAEQPSGRKRWQRIVAAYVQAGRGLGAAHAQGLVHRDFKPANVLVEGDRVQVTDFGIASVRGAVALIDSAAEAVGDDFTTPTVSKAGGAVGTVPYMAPEVSAGEPAGARSDQFSFCVALFESLYGHRPFQGENRIEISESISRGTIVRPASDSGTPDWIYRAVLRGLSKDPRDRWPSMAELLETLSSPDEAEVGRAARVAIAAAIGAAFVALPILAKVLGPPFDRSTYRGVVGQTLSLIGLLLVMAFWKRDLVWATPLNRRAFGGVLAVLVMQIPLEATNAVMGVSIAASDLQHLVLWSGMATMFAVTFDRRFIALALVYLAGLPIGLMWPEQHVLVLGLTNAAFIAFVLLVWRGTQARGERDPVGLEPAEAGGRASDVETQ